MHRIAAHVVRQLKLDILFVLFLKKETITQFVTHTDSHWTASESIIRYSLIDLLSFRLSKLSIITFSQNVFYCVTAERSLTALLYDTDCFIFSCSITVKYDL